MRMLLPSGTFERCISCFGQRLDFKNKVVMPDKRSIADDRWVLLLAASGVWWPPLLPCSRSYVAQVRQQEAAEYVLFVIFDAVTHLNLACWAVYALSIQQQKQSGKELVCWWTCR